jgi:antirestriction protein
MEDWEDTYNTELEAQAAYDELSRLRPNELAEYYIFDVVGDLESALTSDQIKQYFDWKAFARDLGYDGYYEVRAGADTYIFRSF